MGDLLEVVQLVLVDFELDQIHEIAVTWFLVEPLAFYVLGNLHEWLAGRRKQ